MTSRSKLGRLALTSALGIGLGLAVLSGSGCSESQPLAVPQTGTLALAIEAGSVTFASFTYQITGPNGFARSGTLDVSASATVSAVVGGLPAGQGFRITISGQSQDSSVNCLGSAPFDVTAGATAAVTVALQCHQVVVTGAVSVSATLNVCPVIDALGANPAAVTVGSTLALGATAHDADGGPAALTYQWSTTAGSLNDAGAQNPTFTCGAVGPATVTVVVSDGDPGCATTQTIAVSCDAAFALRAAPAELSPGQSSTLQVIASDGAGHAGATYTWGDGLDTFQTGVWSPGSITASATVSYAPAACNALGGGDHLLPVTVTITDPQLAVAGSATAAITVHCPASYYTTKTPYHPLQDPATINAPPAGFQPVFTEMVARHGSRGLSSVKYDAATLAMWTQASADGALTPLGASLGPDVQAIMRANALLGYKVPGITNPGYGNLTQIGINEQKQLAVRLLQRLPDFFTGVAANAGSATPRQILTMSSGMDRAVDSDAFFSGSLATTNPALAPLIVPTAPLTAYPANKPVAQLLGVNHFLLYFHKLSAAADLVTSASDPYFQTYQDSLAFQSFASNADMTAKVAGVLADPTVTTAARAVLEGLFAPSFVDKIANGTYSFSNAGSFTFTSDDGLFTTTVTGDGKTKVKSLSDAASMLYNLYVVAPAMVNELPAGFDFTKYVPTAQAQTLAYLQDAQDFYQMGPSILEDNPATYKMAQALESDLFTEIDAVASGDLSHAAKLRFTHAEIICPIANLLGLDGAATAVPLASTYTYANNPWRGQVVAAMATNQQWDVFRNAGGTVLVRLLYDEKEIDFKPSCAGARYLPGTHFYEYQALKACYGR